VEPGARRAFALLGALAAGGAIVALARSGRAPVTRDSPVGGPDPAGGTAPGPPAPCLEEMIAIPEGTFTMGSPAGQGRPNEHPQRRVKLHAYRLDRTEVTVACYQRCVEEPRNGIACAPSGGKEVSDACNGGRPDRRTHPVNCVRFNDAATYCRWRGARLPTEAEWEYGARGSDGRQYPWPGDARPGPTLLNACGSECLAAHPVFTQERGFTTMYEGSDGWPQTAPVGTYDAGASPFGLLDMAGNVWEWTADWYAAYPPASDVVVDPRGPEHGVTRVDRGGGWGTFNPGRARAATRDYLGPSAREDSVGFRCAAPP
jgi:formylglycine-generating enzyme required for sulfatase activity